ncbi:hypothetical protein F444_23245 [Phytophthora nicotianae P1976]|uniref:Uncharacterized protein n=1 Tax=Phytophthora nicotianae P1976 TaxID=1317066 RepID=A0A080YVG8_PHYNI|nr:hypothetical protein F444_23245 [Phytophthora nicotianae P1976]
MVFRFSTEQDCEMMRDLIRLKQFAAERGTTLDVWDNVAKSLSTALKVELKVKQIRDRLNLLKTRFKTNEQRSKGASGVEESLHAVNIQSHYSDVDGLKEADLAQCAKDIVAESNRRRADREAELSNSDVSDEGSCVSATDSSTSRGSRASKRTNAFLAEVKRQEKRYKEQMDMKVRELEQKQKQFDDRLAFEREQAQAKLQFDMEVQANNRNVILECAKIFSAALVNKD